MTTVYNVHIGLSAWPATTAVTVGQRKSNVGNAYQVITAGTTAGAGGPTGTGSSINDGTAVWKYLSAIDYSSLTAVNTAVAALTSAFATTVQFQFWNDGQISAAGFWGGPGVSGQPIYVPGTLGATSTERLQFVCAPGESWADNGPIAINPNASAGVLLDQTSGASFSIFAYVQNKYVDFDGFQFTSADSAGGILQTLFTLKSWNVASLDVFLTGIPTAAATRPFFMPVAIAPSQTLYLLSGRIPALALRQ